MKLGSKVTYTKKGYVSDFFPVEKQLEAINKVTKKEYTQRKGVIVDILELKDGRIDTTVKWEDIGGYYMQQFSAKLSDEIQVIEGPKEPLLWEEGSRLLNSDGRLGYIYDDWDDCDIQIIWEDGEKELLDPKDEWQLNEWLHNFKEFIHNYEGTKIADNFGEIGFIDEDGEIFFEHGATCPKLFDVDLSDEEMNRYINNYVCGGKNIENPTL
jgi:hypothetical protein